MLKRTRLRFTVSLLLAVIAQFFACAGGTGTTTGNVNPPSNGNDTTELPPESDMTVSKHSLTVAKSGSGKVTSDPVGIDCGTACAMDASSGMKVTLTAALDMPFTQSFWEGCTAWNDSCEVTVTQAKNVSVSWGPEVRPKLVKVPNGTFTMGSPENEVGRDFDEPQHVVTLTTDFWMSESEVTRRQYVNLMGSSPSYFKVDDVPVESATWLEAVTYCNALSAREKLLPCYQITGKAVAWTDGVKCTGYRLPTEAEWEYAARSPADKRFSGSDSVADVAWYFATAGLVPHPVKKKMPNGRGLYDLSGNMSEWVWDYYRSSTYETVSATDPTGPSTGLLRVIRGGSYVHMDTETRVARRDVTYPDTRDTRIGFRIVRSNP